MVEVGEAGCVRAFLVVVLSDRERAFFLLHQCPGLQAGFFLVGIIPASWALCNSSSVM